MLKTWFLSSKQSICSILLVSDAVFWIYLVWLGCGTEDLPRIEISFSSKFKQIYTSVTLFLCSSIDGGDVAAKTE